METKIEIRLPEHFSCHSTDIMSNFDHRINEEIAKEIKGAEMYSHYAGWNFNGKVWWQAGKWHCEVWVFHSHMETISCDTLEEIMSEVCSEYGSD